MIVDYLLAKFTSTKKDRLAPILFCGDFSSSANVTIISFEHLLR